ncbi:conserved Plasmodium chabaudi protein, unknown function [Plasmodium vinckei vinckei]|uniref:Uncharacterized protein n=1 Tax=Plasmodium vinckei vinckei TaxID=54757 RepID=A0A449C160_PLAVN|nr:conserved Plasmodium chabaudi protein, unknown function [Plasmodium vinckei vinckei]KEG03780.1 hypothetical protein YYE_00680 [Plasmodium vinckei vinckei]VEV59425.1 conserved Plasmodium chabaudi protein, unknown function [Plasmodium vinckei vinckei]
MIFRKKDENPSIISRMKNLKNRIGRKILNFMLFFFTAQFVYKMSSITWGLKNNHRKLSPEEIKRIPNETNNDAIQTQH